MDDLWESKNRQSKKYCREMEDEIKLLDWLLMDYSLTRFPQHAIRTIKDLLRCTLVLKTVLRHIQRIYPLEIYVKESVDGELDGEESNSNNMTDKENNVTSADAVIVRKFTSSGRPVKAPTRLDLLNNACYTLETLKDSQGRRMLGNEVK
ncbi:integrase catalytic domain-containing protein [Nephila pilipes]|uniref:Integrase catalytic domain-containing protein n=1 Tax=Nephila pilipes TaxID=299642 RepID=A0A8X6U521_NEPPI|nr:integrase catalytic domain-containing protein [Nephila pilipes]